MLCDITIYVLVCVFVSVSTLYVDISLCGVAMAKIFERLSHLDSCFSSTTLEKDTHSLLSFPSLQRLEDPAAQTTPGRVVCHVPEVLVSGDRFSGQDGESSALGP